MNITNVLQNIDFIKLHNLKNNVQLHIMYN